MLKKHADEGTELPKLQDAKEDKKPLSSSLKEQAEEILKRELAQLEGDKPEEKSQTTETAGDEPRAEPKETTPPEQTAKAEAEETTEQNQEEGKA